MVAGRDALQRPSVGSTSSSSGGSSYFDRYPERKGQGEYVPDQKLAMPRFKTLHRDGTTVMSNVGASGSSNSGSSGFSSVSTMASSTVPTTPLVKTTSKRSTRDADAARRALAAVSASSTSPGHPTRSYSRYAPPPDAMKPETSPTAGRVSLSVDEAFRSREATTSKSTRMGSFPVEPRQRGGSESIYTGRASSSSTSLASSSASVSGTRTGLAASLSSRASPASASTSSLPPSVHYDTLHDSLMTGSKSRTRERLERQHADRMAEAAGAIGHRKVEATSPSAPRSLFASRPATSGTATTGSTSQRSLPSSASSSSVAFVTSSSASTSFESFTTPPQGESSRATNPAPSTSASPTSISPPIPAHTPSSEMRIPSIEEIIARNSGSAPGRPMLPILQSAPHIGAARDAPGVMAPATASKSHDDDGDAAMTRTPSRVLQTTTREQVHRRIVPGRRPMTTPSLPSPVSAPASVPPPVPPKVKEVVPSIDDIINSFKSSLTPERRASIVSKTPTHSTPRLVLPEGGTHGQGPSVNEPGRLPASASSSRRPSGSEVGWATSHARTASMGSESDAASMGSMDSLEREVYTSLRKAKISEQADDSEGDQDADDDGGYFASTSVYSAGTARRGDRYGQSVEVLASPKSSIASGPRSPGAGTFQGFVSLPKRRQSNSSLFSSRSHNPSSSEMNRGSSSPGRPTPRKVVHYSSRHPPRSRTYSGADSAKDGSVASTLQLDTAAAAAPAPASTLRKPSTPLSSGGGFGSHRTSMGPGSPPPVSPMGNAQNATRNLYLRSPRLTQLVTLLRPPYAGSVVSFADVGDPTGHPVVVFLGLGAVRYLIGLYDDMAKAMGLRLICIDRWGMGKTSDMPSSRRGIRPWAFVVIEVLDRLGVRRCSLLAHSAGSPYAMALALALREAADHQADPPPIEVAGPILLLAPWVSSTIDNGYKWLRYVPDSVIKTAQAAEWKMQGWKLGKSQQQQLSANGQGSGSGSGSIDVGGGNASSAPGTPLHSYDAAPVSPPGSISLSSPQSDYFSGAGDALDPPVPSTKAASRSKPNLLVSFLGATNDAGSSSSSSRLSPSSPGPPTPGLGPHGIGQSSPYRPPQPRRAFSSRGDGEGDVVSHGSRVKVQLWRSSSSVAIASSYATPANGGGARRGSMPGTQDGGATGSGPGTTSADSDFCRAVVEDQLGELRNAGLSSSLALVGSGREKRSARIASWIASDAALAMLDGRFEAPNIPEDGGAPSPSATATPVLSSDAAHQSFRLDGSTSGAVSNRTTDEEPSLDLATALLRASHAESLKGGSADLLTILGRSSQQPWGFTYADVAHPTLVWHGDKDEKINLNGALWMERHMDRCELRIVQGAGHGLMTNVDVVVEALETASKFA